MGCEGYTLGGKSNPKILSTFRGLLFVEAGLDAALERKEQQRPSRAKKLDGEKEARLIAVACSEPPSGRAKWTLHMLADELVSLKVVDEISHETVRQTLKKTNLSLICGNAG